MKIVTGVLKNQPQEFVDMVTNAKPGMGYIYSYPNQIVFSYDIDGNPQPAIFVCESVEPITTRFGSRDRILHGARYKFDKLNEKLIFVEKTAIWCSQLADTEPFPGNISEYITKKLYTMNTYPFTYEDHIKYAKETLGLEHTTSKIQEKNLTMEFYDPKTNCYYTLHNNGYIRRKFKNLRIWWGIEKSVSYQLNPTKQDPVYKRSRNRVLFPGDYEKLFKLMEKAVHNYRKRSGYKTRVPEYMKDYFERKRY